ncbi:MAG: glycosyltransferase family 9 protein [Gemmatimonadaceae bacterium]
MRPFFAKLPNEKARIAIVRLCDATALLCAVPALRAIRAAAPNAHVTLVGLDSAAEMAARFSAYIDEFLSPQLCERTAAPFDLVIELQEPDAQLLAVSARLVGTGGVGGTRLVAGFCKGSPNGSTNSAAFRAEWPEQGPEVLRLLTLVRALGIRDCGDTLEFPFEATDRTEMESCREALALLGGPFVCIQPGGRWPERRWQAARFARVADALASHGLRVALTGTDADRPVTAAVAARMRARPIDLAGRLTNGAFAVLLDYAYLLVSNDTGVTRLAEAIGTPSVTIASGSDVPLWRPSDRVRYRVLWLPGTERPSIERLYSSWPDHASGISVESVLDACDVLLAEPALKQRAAVRAHLARLRHEARLSRSVATAPTSRRRAAPMVRRAS